MRPLIWHQARQKRAIKVNRPYLVIGILICVETRSTPVSLIAIRHGFTFHVAHPTRSIHSCLPGRSFWRRLVYWWLGNA